MKKALVGTLALALLAVPVFGADSNIVGSAHDLSSSNTTYTRSAGEAHPDTAFDQICAYCHTPHTGKQSDTAPLWNRTDPTVTGYTYYNSASLTSAATPTNVKLSVADSDVPLCMSCHDGTSLTAVLLNPVGDGDYGDATITTVANIGATSMSLLIDDANSFKNDHPVGFNYVSAQSDVNESELKAKATAEGLGVKFYGPDKDMMWCSSCHAVHAPGSDTDTTAPFLRTSNSASALCLACHDK